VSSPRTSWWARIACSLILELAPSRLGAIAPSD
jgi:hypothetical protein